MTDYTHLTREADYPRSVVSVDLVDRDTTDSLIAVPQNAHILMVAFEVVKVFGSTATVSVGTLADPDFFLKTGDITQTALGWYKNGTGPGGKGYWFSSGPDVITATISKGNSAATATGRVHVFYNLVY